MSTILVSQRSPAPVSLSPIPKNVYDVGSAACSCSRIPFAFAQVWLLPPSAPPLAGGERPLSFRGRASSASVKPAAAVPERSAVRIAMPLDLNYPPDHLEEEAIPAAAHGDGGPCTPPGEGAPSMPLGPGFFDLNNSPVQEPEGAPELSGEGGAAQGEEGAGPNLLDLNMEPDLHDEEHESGANLTCNLLQ
ncbi:hypothetical protein EJB05_28954, partial [Eragrostis curvula]